MEQLTARFGGRLLAQRQKGITVNYSIKIKLTDDTLKDTRFDNMDEDTACELMEGIWMGTAPRDEYAGIAVVDENGDIYSELEW